jgi:spoIIIJ-associated protein
VSTVQFTAKSEEDAVQKAADNLSIAASDVSYKIVSRTSGGLLGMLGQQVVTIEVTLQETVVEAPAAPATEPEAPTDEVEGAPDADQEPAAQPPERKRQRRPRKPRRERSRASDDKDDAPVEVDEVIFKEKLEKAGELLTDIVEIVGSSAVVKTYRKENQIIVSIVGELPGWFGRGASRTVEALQFLANKIVNRFPPRYRVIIVTEGKREERLENLQQAAGELAGKLSDAGETAWIVPLNPKERRIVHLAVAPLEGIETHSFGDGNGRRLRIARTESKSE